MTLTTECVHVWKDYSSTTDNSGYTRRCIKCGSLISVVYYPMGTSFSYGSTTYTFTKK